jgi:peptide-methionine (S)-S-oxide reductase
MSAPSWKITSWKMPSWKSAVRALPVLAAGAACAAALLPLARGSLFAHADELAAPVPPPAVDLPVAGPGQPSLQTVVLSGGCFWGVQGVFEHVRGVTRAVSGYAGGSAANAQYETVSTGETGHAESVSITYDPAVVTFGKLLRIFFSVALDPTQVNQQGPDWGTQYRSEIWVNGAEQARVARAYIAQLDAAHVFPAPIATRVDELPGFYPAEEYHQDYLTRYPDNPYIAINDVPKVRSLQRLFPDAYRATPVTVLKLPRAS